ncbi:MAG TPA: CBS domain-containing protein [Kofleriaceae bacterium]|nr:CBS domain-containing protein [Kofleriaceae bacterium]
MWTGLSMSGSSAAFEPGTADAPAHLMHDQSIAITLRARDFMQTDVMTVSPETSILDIHRMFVEEEIHGAPVVDDTGRVRGVVSTLDLLRVVSEEAEPNEHWLPYFRSDSLAVPDQFPERLNTLTAADIMTRELVTVGPNLPIADVARTMREQHVHRVLVIEDHELLGVITTFDLLGAFIGGEAVPRAKRTVSRVAGRPS